MSSGVYFISEKEHKGIIGLADLFNLFFVTIISELYCKILSKFCSHMVNKQVRMEQLLCQSKIENRSFEVMKSK